VNSEDSPAFLAASQGYDVWLGNGRGNSYSRKHLKWDPDKDKSEYWNFSWQHSANDIPATLEYIVKETGFQKVAYIGHSQGTTQMFANLPINQEYYKERISVFIALGPIARLSSTKSPAFNALSFFYVQVDNVLRASKIHELMGRDWALSNMDKTFCKFIPNLCDDLIRLMTYTINPKYDSIDRFRVLASH